MKPAFALDFRDGSVALLHRTARGWMAVGQTSFDSPDMEEALGYLRSTALGLSPGGVATKLIIPNDQILYTTVHAPGPDAAKRRRQIAAALEGRTPYPVADLVYDWWGKGDEVNVAVIARETLAEAEGFAHAHRFNPVAFVGVPDNGIYQGEPWFGLTSVSSEILAAGEKVDRDQDPVRVIGRDPAPEPVPVVDVVGPEPALPAPAPLPEPTPDLPPTPMPVPAPMPEPTPEPQPVDIPDVMATPEPRVDSRPEPRPLPPSVAAQRSKWEVTPLNVAPNAEFAPEPEVPVYVAPPAPEPVQPAPAQPAPALPVAFDEPDEAPMALDVDADPGQSTGFAPDEEPEVEVRPEDLMRGTVSRSTFEPAAPASSGFSLLRAFTSRRKEPEAAPKAEPGLSAPPVTFSAPPQIRAATGSVTDPNFDARLDAEFDPIPDMPAHVAPESSGMAVIGAASRGSVLGAGQPTRLTAERPSLARPLPNTNQGKSAVPKAAKAMKGFGAFVTSPSITGPKKPRVATPAQAPGTAPSANPSGLSPARPGNRPIGLGARPDPQRGKPRFLGLILTGILLVLLALVAAWSTILASNNAEDGSSDTNVAALSQPGAVIPAPEDEMLADMQDPADFTESEAADATGAEVDLTTDSSLIEDPPAEEATAAATPEPALEDAPETGLVSETGAATVTPAGDGQDEIFLASIDSPPQPSDPSALEVPAARSDALPDPAVPPPPFGTVYQFDADGMIVPTPEGIATPEGVLLVAGKPPVVPTSRTAAVVAAAAAAAPVPEAGVAVTPETGAGNPSTVLTDSATETSAPVFADPALQGFRPLPRPATLVVPTQNGAVEDPALAPATESRFTSLRPRARPATQVSTNSVPAVDEAAIEAAMQTASLVTGEVLPADRSPLAVSVSRKPAARPAGLSTAAAAAATAPVQEASASSSNSQPAPEADAEPETSGSMPALPTSASVAKQATVKNAVNLSQLTLIGVYGSEGRRYALVRQPNGRLVKVKVGDKLDGGKVAAISTSALTYSKGGRSVTLEMPRT